MVWLFGRDDDDAVRRAVQIASFLPYVIVSNEVTVFSEPYSDDPKDSYHEEVARKIGLSIALARFAECPDLVPKGKIIRFDS